MRGILELAIFLQGHSRITPVYAGNTEFVFCAVNGREDHPRLCGEYSLRSCGSSARLGSPPSMRGIRRCHFMDPHFPRDHPRLCGEYVIFVIVVQGY